MCLSINKRQHVRPCNWRHVCYCGRWNVHLHKERWSLHYHGVTRVLIQLLMHFAKWVCALTVLFCFGFAFFSSVGCDLCQFGCFVLSSYSFELSYSWVLALRLHIGLWKVTEPHVFIALSVSASNRGFGLFWICKEVPDLN